MDDFSTPGTPNAFGLAPSPYNCVYPGKRPQSSSVPVIIEKDGKVVLVAGASGGSHITTSTLQVIIRCLSLGQDPLKAVDSHRFHHQWLPNRVWAEQAIHPSILEHLQKVGHEVVVGKPGEYHSGVSAVKQIDNQLIGAGEYRKSGMAVGY
jgi:gamma-glutamyltranspeptidase / glutathione hydrolase / leukotriene-C4 hydrolase